MQNIAQASINELIEQFSGLIAQFQQQVKVPESLTSQLEQLYSLSCEQPDCDSRNLEQKRVILAQNLVKRQIGRRIAQIFPRLDRRILGLERWLVVEWPSESLNTPPVVIADGRSRPEDLPLDLNGRSKRPWIQAVKVPLVLERSQALSQVPALRHPKAGSRRWDGQFQAKVAFPGPIPHQLERQAGEAKAIFFEVLAQVCRAGFGNLAEQLRLQPPTIDALWIPLLEDISFTALPPQTRDPALVVRYDQRLYVVGTWVVQREQSLDDLLSEFTDD